MEIRWNLYYQVVATHVPFIMKNLLKSGKFSFYLMVDCETFTNLKHKKKLISIVNKKFKIFDF